MGRDRTEQNLTVIEIARWVYKLIILVFIYLKFSIMKSLQFKKERKREKETGERGEEESYEPYRKNNQYLPPPPTPPTSTNNINKFLFVICRR